MLNIPSSKFLLWEFIYDCFSYYNKQWTDAQQMIGDLIQLEVPPDEAKPEKVVLYECL